MPWKEGRQRRGGGGGSERRDPELTSGERDCEGKQDFECRWLSHKGTETSHAPPVASGRCFPPPPQGEGLYSSGGWAKAGRIVTPPADMSLLQNWPRRLPHSRELSGN